MFYSAKMYKHLDFGIDFLWIFQAMEDHGQQTAPKIVRGRWFFEDLRHLPFRGQTALQVTWGGSSEGCPEWSESSHGGSWYIHPI